MPDIIYDVIFGIASSVICGMTWAMVSLDHNDIWIRIPNSLVHRIGMHYIWYWLYTNWYMAYMTPSKFTLFRVPSSLIRGIHHNMLCTKQFGMRNWNALYMILIVHKLIHGIYDTMHVYLILHTKQLDLRNISYHIIHHAVGKLLWTWGKAGKSP